MFLDLHNKSFWMGHKKILLYISLTVTLGELQRWRHKISANQQSHLVSPWENYKDEGPFYTREIWFVCMFEWFNWLIFFVMWFTKVLKEFVSLLQSNSNLMVEKEEMILMELILGRWIIEICISNSCLYVLFSLFIVLVRTIIDYFLSGWEVHQHAKIIIILDTKAITM